MHICARHILYVNMEYCVFLYTFHIWKFNIAIKSMTFVYGNMEILQFCYQPSNTDSFNMAGDAAESTVRDRDS